MFLRAHIAENSHNLSTEISVKRECIMPTHSFLLKQRLYCRAHIPSTPQFQLNSGSSY